MLYPDDRMSQNKDISSTEQLLDVIRGTKEVPGKNNSGPSRPPVRTRKLRMASGKLDPRKTIVGISHDSSGVWLVAMERSGRTYSLVDYAHISMEIPENADVKTIIDALSKEDYSQRFVLKKVPVWFLLRSESIEQWTITVPKKIEGKEEAKAIFWAAKAKKKFDETASIFDYYHIDECVEKGIEKLRVGLFTIPRSNVYEVRDSFASAGISLAGISSFSLCASRLLPVPPKDMDNPPVAIIRVDQEWSRIDLFHEHALAFTRRIKTGVESLALSIQDRYQASAPVAVQAGGLELELELEEEPSHKEELSLEEALDILWSQGSASHGDGVAPALSEEAFITLIEPAVQRLVRQIERTFDHFRASMKVPPLRKILFVGQLAKLESVVKYIGTQLDVEVGILDPFSADSVTTSLPIPSSTSTRASYAAALAATLSDPQNSPNFLYNYQSKIYSRQLKRVHSILLASFLGCALVIAGYFMYSQKILDAKTAENQHLTKEIANYSGDVNAAQTRKLLGEFTRQNLFLKEYTARFVPVGVFSEITRITPSSIGINSLIYNNKDAEGTSSIVLDGVVVGDSPMLDSYLSNYMAILDDSPLFTEPVIQKRNRLKSGGKEQIRFIINMNIK